jgi:hypothetical protein
VSTTLAKTAPKERGRYCRYDGTISSDWWSFEGRYTCTWERMPMPWHQGVRLGAANLMLDRLLM